MEGFRLIAIEEPIDTERGWKYDVHPFSDEGVRVIKRNKGTISGKHWHKGKSPAKSPEKGYLLEGSGTWIIRDEQGNEETLSMTAPARWEIDPGIYHELHADTDIIFFEGCHPLDKEDTYYNV